VERLQKALTGEEYREAFEELMDMYRNNAMASGNACNPVPKQNALTGLKGLWASSSQATRQDGLAAHGINQSDARSDGSF
jgi:hypothetical protein